MTGTAAVDSVPAFDLARAARLIEAEVEERWRRLRRDTAFVGGGEVAEFERAFAAFVGGPDCVGVANGTDAIELALRALDLRPGEEVVVPAFSFVATGTAVELAGGVPVFADVEPQTLNLDPASAAAAVGERTVGVIGVHLYGRPFDVAAVRAVCRNRGLWLIEDAAQAHGAEVGGERVGTLGKLATWSFYPSKNLGCFGDGGAVTGADPEALARLRRLANHGSAARYEHVEVGRNSRLDALQAAVLNCRLPRLEGDNRRRREIACRYHEELDGVGDLALLRDPEGSVSVYHQLTVRTRSRDELQRFLAERGVGSTVHYPRALHEQPALRHRAGGALPVAEAAAREVLCLPMFPELTEGEVERVCALVREFFGGA